MRASLSLEFLLLLESGVLRGPHLGLSLHLFSIENWWQSDLDKDAVGTLCTTWGDVSRSDDPQGLTDAVNPNAPTK
jgi:hypothetical protein